VIPSYEVFWGTRQFKPWQNILKAKIQESVSNPYYSQVKILIMHNMNALKIALQGQGHE